MEFKATFKTFCLVLIKLIAFLMKNILKEGFKSMSGENINFLLYIKTNVIQFE